MLEQTEMIYELLFESFSRECSHFDFLEKLDRDAFFNYVKVRCDSLEKIFVEDKNDRAAAFYSRWDENGVQMCSVPSFGYYASSKKAAVKLFSRLSETILQEGDAKIMFNVYAHDFEFQRALSMLQFYFMSEKAIRKIDMDAKASFNDVEISVLSKQQISGRWSEVWSLTEKIIEHLQKPPVYYRGEEFTKEVYREFFLDESTTVHAAIDSEGRMVGIIESNQEPNELYFQGASSVNVGEAYVIEKYRGTGLARALLMSAENYEGTVNKAVYSWVEHGTANPNAMGFWDKYFEPVQYEMIREIKKADTRVI